MAASKLFPLNMRTTLETRRKVEAAASASGRSMVQEVERRLELSFRDEKLDQAVAELTRMVQDLTRRVANLTAIAEGRPQFPEVGSPPAWLPGWLI